MDSEFYDCEDPSRSTFSIAKNEVGSHYHFGESADRYWIQPAALLRSERPGSLKLLIQVESLEEKEIADELARYFHEETGFDFAPYSSKESRPDDEHVFLIRTPELMNTSYDFVVGAVGVEKADDEQHVVMWFWLHPFFRSSGSPSLALAAWQELETIFGELAVLDPVSKPMLRFIEKNRPDTKFYS